MLANRLLFLPLSAVLDAAPPASIEIHPPASEVFAASARAMGGHAALSKIESISAIARCTSPRGPYETEIRSARGDRLFFRQTPEQGQPFVAVVNGSRAWRLDPKSGRAEPLGSHGRAVVRGHDFQMMALRFPERHPEAAVEGYEEFAGARTIRLRIKDEFGGTGQAFFEVSTGLLRGRTTTSPDGETIITVFDQWRRVGDVMLPSRLKVTDPTGEFVLDFHEIQINSVDEKIFAVPPQVEGKGASDARDLGFQTLRFGRVSESSLSFRLCPGVAVSPARRAGPRAAENRW